MGIDYRMQVGKVENEADSVEEKAAEYLELIDETTALVDGLATDWEGDTYQTFRESYYGHLQELENLNTALKQLAGELYAKAEKTKGTIHRIGAMLGK